MEIKIEDLFNGVCEICEKESFVLPRSNWDRRVVCAGCDLAEPSLFFTIMKEYEKQRAQVKKLGFIEYKNEN